MSLHQYPAAGSGVLGLDVEGGVHYQQVSERGRIIFVPQSKRNGPGVGDTQPGLTTESLDRSDRNG